MLYLTSKDDDLLDDSGSLVLEELLDDVVAYRAGPEDGEFSVSRHEVIVLSVVCGCCVVVYSYFTPLFFYLFTF